MSFFVYDIKYVLPCSILQITFSAIEKSFLCNLDDFWQKCSPLCNLCFAKWLRAALNIFAVILEKHFGGMPQFPGSLPGTSFTSSLSMNIIFVQEIAAV